MIRKIMGGVFGVVVLGVATMAGARGNATVIPAMAGHVWVSNQSGAQLANDQACFRSAWSQVTNVCGVSKKLLIPVQSSVGFFDFRASAPASLCGLVTCRAIVTNNANGFINQTPEPSVCASGTFLGQLGVNNLDVAHFDCDVGAQGVLDSVEFNTP
jgi:hypothetical protein